MTGGPVAGSLEWLADCIAREAADERRRHPMGGGPRYMINVNHPAGRRWYAAWKAQRGLPPNVPPSDRERALFDLEMVQCCDPEAYAEILAGYMERKTAAAAAWRAAGLPDEDILTF